MGTLKSVNEILSVIAGALGSKRYPEFRSKSQLLDPHPELFEFIVGLGEKHGVYKNPQLTSWYKVAVDPWQPVVKELGYDFPTKGMATYFVTYIATVAMVSRIDTLFVRIGLASLARSTMPVANRIRFNEIMRVVGEIARNLVEHQIGYLSLMETVDEEGMPNTNDYKVVRNHADDFIVNSRKHPAVIEQAS